MTSAGTSDAPAHGDAAGDERRATLRWRPASLTETVGRAPFNHGHRTGKGAR
ncbi:DUF6380 family protein [Streptomyces sp. HMX87]|uniref:DUF6380 family protein n=1 Tax=Streptomyces sp. HMX87 TaxID=3390849 RepID=UPI003A8C6044